MCDQRATTSDHIPPQCFFPEKKDISKGKDYRKNLVRIPACKKHNLRTSKDDEYIWAVIALHWQNQTDVQEYSVKKIRRAFERNKRFFYAFFGEHNKRNFFTYKREKLVATTFDIDRFNTIMQKIAYGIYYRHYDRKWINEITIHSRSLAIFFPNPNPVYDEIHRVAELARPLCIFQPRHGENPEIFYYQIAQNSPLSSPILRLVFYGGFEVLAFFYSPS